MIYEERINLRDELFKTLKSINVIDKRNRFIKLKVKTIDNELKRKLDLYVSEFREFDEAIYCLLHHDDYENHKCPICNKFSAFQNVKPKRFKTTCGSKKCVSDILHSKESNKKRKNVMIEKYGVEYPLQIKEIQEKIKQTSLERYGVDNPIKSKEIQDRVKKSNLEKYGVEWVMQSKEVQNKVKATNLERYGYECSSKNEDVKEKARQTNLERYGVEWTNQNKDIKEKQIRTWQERYGVIDPILENEVLSLFNNKYTLIDIYLKSNLFKQLII